MATIIRLKYSPDSHLSITEKARAILEKGGDDTPILITDPALLVEIERLNAAEYQCKLSVEFGGDGDAAKHSYGRFLSPELTQFITTPHDTNPT